MSVVVKRKNISNINTNKYEKDKKDENRTIVVTQKEIDNVIDQLKIKSMKIKNLTIEKNDRRKKIGGYR